MRRVTWAWSRPLLESSNAAHVWLGARIGKLTGASDTLAAALRGHRDLAGKC